MLVAMILAILLCIPASIWGQNAEHRYLVVTGEPDSGYGVMAEIIDISNPQKSCKLDTTAMNNEPASGYRYASTGALLGSFPIICGGYSGNYWPSVLDECVISFDPSQKISMNQRRKEFASIAVNSTTLWVVGGIQDTVAFDSTEFISIDGGSVSGPNMPKKSINHCMVKNPVDGTIYILGGYNYDEGALTDVLIVNPADSFSITQGPYLNNGNHKFGCGAMFIGSDIAIIAAGGEPNPDYVEILIPSTTNTWQSGPLLPSYGLYGSVLETTPDKNGVLLFGGYGYSSYYGGYSDKILQLKSDGVNWVESTWTTLEAKLQYPRVYHVVIPIMMLEDSCDLSGIVTEMGCTDVGNLCSSAFNGAGVCVNTTDANWDELHQNFDLSQPNVTGACLSDPDCSCCQCFKNKTWVQEMEVKYLVAGGDASNNDKTEIIDISDSDMSCDLDYSISYTYGYSGGNFGGLLGSTPVICNGNGQGCIIIGTSQTITMNHYRSYAAAVALNSTTLWVVGGSNSYDSTEFISIDGGSVDGPNVPTKNNYLQNHCMVKNPIDGKVYILGGHGTDDTRSDVLVVKTSDSFSMATGPQMNAAREQLGCAIMSIGSHIAIIAAGGACPNNCDDYNSALDSVEILITSTTNTWISGPKLPSGRKGSVMITTPDKNGVLMFGGYDETGNSLDTILQMKSDGMNWVDGWTTLEAKLKYPRYYHVVIPILMAKDNCDLNTIVEMPQGKACTDDYNLCSNAFNGAGTCINVTNADWDELQHNFDLSQPNVPGACLASADESCCRCFKNKTCMDTGCKDEFGGSGICLDVNGPMDKFDIDWEAGRDPKPNLCQHTLKKDCCSCFKMNDKIMKTCKNDMCEEKGGKCVMPDMTTNMTAMEGWDWKFYCDKELDCKCYMPEGGDDETVCENDMCSMNEGKCIMPDENPPPNYMVKGFCNKELGCKCYAPKTDPQPQECKNEKCEKIMGICITKGQSVASDLASFYQPATGNTAFCDKASGCKCYKPKCKTTKKCKQAKGKCFSNKIAPSGWSLVKKKGKNIVCKKSLKCYCYKQDDGKSERSLDDDDDDLDLEDGPEDYLESEEDFDDDFELEKDI